MRGIFYRSDTREPDRGAHVFRSGFTKRESPAPLESLERTTAGSGRRAPDVMREPAVCFTRELHAAPIFPMEDLNCPSWVYVLDLELDSVLRTQHIPHASAAQRGANTAADGRTALWPMLGQERCTNAVAPSEIVGALLVERSFFADFASGGTFLGRWYLSNPGYVGELAEPVEQQMQAMVAEADPKSTPTQTLGVVRQARG